MGDGGAIPLGFLAAGFTLEASARGVLPLWFPALVFSPFWVDASATLVRRLLRGERVWEAHREHQYQRWVLKLGRHGPVLLAEIGLMLTCAVSGMIMLDIPSAAMQWTGLTAWSVVYAVLIWVGPSSSAR
jgi:UDP-N-acetylmuramyl pentapeptide phosphotransferase/UDP-N-acetylglucosamine-1-phosphate transferase